MNTHSIAALCLASLAGLGAQAAVTTDEAARLKTTLTPTGAERAGNADGSIPAWTGGYTTPLAGFVNGGKRPDPFASDKPIYSVTGANLAQHAGKLSEGALQMFKRHPDYRIDVYATRRTFAAPQYIYDRTAANALGVSMVEQGDGGPTPAGYAGGFPFPIPKNGAEAITNHRLRWNGDGVSNVNRQYLVTAEGKVVLSAENLVDSIWPANMATPLTKDWDGFTNIAMIKTLAPALSKGSTTASHAHMDANKDLIWTYLTGQRRVRKLPNACCDTPAPNAAGVLNFDEVQVFNGSLKRYDWKLAGKREMLIPYNTNRLLTPKESELLKGRFLNPDHLRWELHRVWVIEAALKPGQRHVYPKATFYLDEDSWIAVLADRWDAQGQIAKSSWTAPIVAPDYPAILPFIFGSYDFSSGAWLVINLVNEQPVQFKRVTAFPANHFSPDSMEGEGVR